MQQTNPLSPHRMTPEQRVHEVANIIAQGIIRLKAPIQIRRNYWTQIAMFHLLCLPIEAFMVKQRTPTPRRKN